MSNKKIVTCDIDGVLTDYPKCWLDFLQEKTGILYDSTIEAKEKEPNYSQYKDLYRESNYKATLPILESNKHALNQLAETYDILVVTSRPINDEKYPHLKENTYNWLKSNGLKFKDLRFKDEDANFLENLNFAFHIDDEIKYVNSVSKRIKSNNNYDESKVYLLNPSNSLDLESLDDNVIVVKDIQEIVEAPFFSVCIPAVNRGDTIYRALNSVAKQTYRNFELIIVDCESKDNTSSEIKRFFSSDDYKKNPFKYKFEKKNYVPVGTEDWNDPIKLATGKYIAMLEGDDEWLSDHLMNAYSVLSENQNIGIYGSSNLSGKRSFQGLLKNEKARDSCYILNNGPVPPSESIFIRLNSENKPFLYNSHDYKYSPEIALYVDITIDGYDLYYSQKQDVYREPSTNPDKLQTWYYFADRFVLIDNYKSFFGKNIVFNSKIYNGVLVFKFAFYTKSFNKGSALIKNLIKKIGIFMTVICSIIAAVNLLIDFINIKLKNL